MARFLWRRGVREPFFRSSKMPFRSFRTVCDVGGYGGWEISGLAKPTRRSLRLLPRLQAVRTPPRPCRVLYGQPAISHCASTQVPLATLFCNSELGTICLDFFH